MKKILLLILSSVTTFGFDLGDGHFMLSVPIESSPGHDYLGFRISGAGPINSVHENLNLHLGGEIGAYDIIYDDAFLRLKFTGDISYYHRFKEEGGHLSRLTPFVKGGIEWDYFSNETTYTTGYDYSPLAYSDYYWEYYYTTGTSFSFFNFNFSTGLEYELIKDKLSLSYSFLYLIPELEDVQDVKTNKIELHYTLKSGSFIYLSYQMEDLNVYDNDLWTIGWGSKF